MTTTANNNFEWVREAVEAPVWSVQLFMHVPIPLDVASNFYDFRINLMAHPSLTRSERWRIWSHWPRSPRVSSIEHRPSNFSHHFGNRTWNTANTFEFLFLHENLKKIHDESQHRKCAFSTHCSISIRIRSCTVQVTYCRFYHLRSESPTVSTVC